jgi:hypothetical protein
MAKENLKRILEKGLKNQTVSSNLEELQKEGFPLAMVKTFLQTADNLDCVITSRIPEGPAGGLIAEGYDLKGYEIKSKSCTWGPMAGFLCKLPPLNKYGSGKIKYNYGYLRSFYTKWTKWNKTFDDLFQPIQISNERKTELFANKNNIFDLGNKDEGYIELGNNAIYGICSSGEKAKGEDKIRMEYYLEKDAKLDIWSIYHGVIFYLKEKKEIPYTGNEGEKFFIKDTDKNKLIIDKIVKPALGSKIILAEETGKKKITELRKLNNFQTDTFIFNKIEGAKNIYPPYPKRAPNKKRFWKKRNNTQVQPIVDISNIDNPDYYKNCVTGDYDLFACWPKLTYPIQELIRAAEHKLESRIEKDGEKKITTTIPGKFFRNFGKPLSLSLCPSEVYNHIYIEFIPGIPILEDLEIPDKGNITDLTEMVAGTLNSISGFSFENENIIINKAFHNDEGGRPSIDDIEFPVAYFIPDSLFEKLKTQNTPFAIKFKDYKGGLLKNIQDFLDLIMACTENGHRVSLNYGWIIFMISHALTDIEFHAIIKDKPIDVEATKYYKKTIEGKKEDCIDSVLKYLFGYSVIPSEVSVTSKVPLSKEVPKRYKATEEFLIKVANVFLPFLDMTETDTSVIIRKVNEAKSIEIQESDFEEDKETYTS